ncbi:MAG: glycosyltransferase family 39 protein [Planctomycetaceae bacterium]|nr:glycosyltransferase family 39 protein [Planctomycetaceae bacterium]
MSFWNSPNGNEPGHLAAGVYTLRFGRNDLYRVNPPLSRMIAAIPATYCFGIDADWLSTATNVLSYRPEYEVGTSLYFKNEPDKLYYAFVFGRLMLLPFSLLGAWTCYRFAFLLYGQAAALFALILWCFNPYILTWSATINPDITATSLGIFCFYLFWQWCHQPSWWNTFWVGGVAGLLLVSKTVWILIFGILPALCVLACLFYAKNDQCRLLLKSFGKLCIIFVTSIIILNVFYNFSGSCKLLKQYSFISASLSGNSSENSNWDKNRFAQSSLGLLPIPLPQDYLYGIDVQKYDFERGIPSYVNGTWSEHGFRYYYLYAFLLKTPIGVQVLILVAVVLSFAGKQYRSDFFSEIVLIFPLSIILILISSQTGFSVHSRYLLPLLPFLFVWTSKTALVIFDERFNFVKTSRKQVLLQVLIVFFVVWGVISSLSVFPHSMSYFNEFAGGSCNGAKYLLGSDLDWGQDVYHLQHWQKKHPDARPIRIALSGTMPLEKTEIKYDGAIPKEGDGTNVLVAIRPGWYAVNVNNLYGKKNEYSYLKNKKPTARVGYSILLYYFGSEEINVLRKNFKLPSLEEEEQQITAFFEILSENKSDVDSKRTVAIYSGTGAASDSVDAIATLHEKENISHEKLTIQNIRSGNISKYDLLIVPGGLSNEMADALGNEGREAIRHFVHSGGGYVGICAGAYLASSTFEKFLGLVNIKTNHTQEYMPRIGILEQRQLGSATVKVEFSTEGKKLFATNQFENINYINGPIFIEAGRSDLPSCITLATYRSDVYSYRFQQGTMPNTPAIIAGQFGQGNVILFSPHPELTEGMESIIHDAVRSARKGKIKN